jgi:hypothetical protein
MNFPFLDYSTLYTPELVGFYSLPSLLENVTSSGKHCGHRLPSPG